MAPTQETESDQEAALDSNSSTPLPVTHFLQPSSIYPKVSTTLLNSTTG